MRLPDDKITVSETFFSSKRTRPQSYDEAEALDKFNQLVLANPSENQLQHMLDDVGGRSCAIAQEGAAKKLPLNERVAEGVHEEVIALLMPEVLARRYTEQRNRNVSGQELDNAFDRALGRLFQIKAAKTRIRFRERLRFDRTHPE